MTKRVKHRWIAAGVIWAMVVGMTAWNIHLANTVHNRRQTLERELMDLRFVNENQSDINHLHQIQAGRIHRVASFDLGFVMVESDLQRIAFDFGLHGTRIEAAQPPFPGAPVSISIIAMGTLPALIGWIGRIEAVYPYLRVQEMDVYMEKNSHRGRIEVLMEYAHAPKSPEAAG